MCLLRLVGQMINIPCVCVLCSRVSSVPVESRVWELCVELDKDAHMLGVSRSGNNYTVSESV